MLTFCSGGGERKQTERQWEANEKVLNAILFQACWATSVGDGKWKRIISNGRGTKTPNNPNYYLIINEFKAMLGRSGLIFSPFYQTTAIKRAVLTSSWHLMFTFFFNVERNIFMLERKIYETAVDVLLNKRKRKYVENVLKMLCFGKDDNKR